MRRPLLLPLFAVLLGILGARLLVAPVVVVVLIVAIYGAAVCAYVRSHAAFLPLVLIDAACAAWMLASLANAGATAGRHAGGRGVEPVVLEGVLRQDAGTATNGVSLSLDAGAAGGTVATVSGGLAADRLDQWRAGRLVRMSATLRDPRTFANPGLRDERLALQRRGVQVFASVKSAALVEVVRRGGWWRERAADIRAFARRAVGDAVGRWSQQSAAIVIAILIGDRAGLSADVERRLQEAGTYHVIAISGGNIAILAGFLLGACRVLGISTRVAACATIAVLAAYADLVGGGASVVRATLMGVAWLVALAFDLRGSPVNALLAAACTILAATPLASYDVAFALTFGATLGILVASQALAGRLPRRSWLRVPAGLLLASASAELALLPVGAYAFSRVTFAGLVLNFFAIPLMAVAQLAGTFVLPLTLVDARAAAAAGWVAHVGASGLVSTASLVDLMPGLTWRVPAPGPLVLAAYYAAFGVWFAARALVPPNRPRVRSVLRASAVAMLIVSASWILWSPLARLRGARPTGLLRLTVIDVGQADSMLVRFPDARTMVVDAGGSRAGGTFDIGGRVIAPVLWHHDVFAIDRFVLTHGDPDHLGGAGTLLRAFPVGEIWEGIDVPRDAALQQFHRDAAAAGVRTRVVRAGDALQLGGAQLRVWHPPPPDWERQKIRNDDSIVMEIRYGGVSLLLTGDVGLDVERPLARRLRVAPLCVMKVPHHGSPSSSAPALMAAVRPALAIFTVGPSAIGTPALDGVVARYTSLGAQVLRTGEDGAVEVETDGRELRVTTFSGRRFVLRQPPL